MEGFREIDAKELNNAIYNILLNNIKQAKLSDLLWLKRSYG